jgi:hypothetical protein
MLWTENVDTYKSGRGFGLFKRLSSFSLVIARWYLSEVFMLLGAIHIRIWLRGQNRCVMPRTAAAETQVKRLATHGYKKNGQLRLEEQEV